MEKSVQRAVPDRFCNFVNMGFTFLIEDADIHFSGVQIDTAIVLVLLIVKSHSLASFGWGL
jgi:hypothetical protein